MITVQLHATGNETETGRVICNYIMERNCSMERPLLPYQPAAENLFLKLKFSKSLTYEIWKLSKVHNFLKQNLMISSVQAKIGIVQSLSSPKSEIAM